jgi:hypothetical protein
MSHSYTDLIVWQKAKTLATAVYRITEAFPNKNCMVSRRKRGEPRSQLRPTLREDKAG